MTSSLPRPSRKPSIATSLSSSQCSVVKCIACTFQYQGAEEQVHVARACRLRVLDSRACLRGQRIECCVVLCICIIASAVLLLWSKFVLWVDEHRQEGAAKDGGELERVMASGSVRRRRAVWQVYSECVRLVRATGTSRDEICIAPQPFSLRTRV